MINQLLWRKLTETDFNAMHGRASPHGHGGGARHISLGVLTETFPVRQFLAAGRHTNVTVQTAPDPGKYERATLSFKSIPDRRGGEWFIRDQFSHRHPAFSPDVGFPTKFNPSNPPIVLIFRVDNAFHIRYANAISLSRLHDMQIPSGLLSRQKGIEPVSAGFLAHFGVPATTLTKNAEQMSATLRQIPFDPQNVHDGRRRILAEVVRRQGQQQFRKDLLYAYSSRCVVSRCGVTCVLEAAHITPYLGLKTNHLTNGLLLRADLHTLFDLALLSIDPDRMKIRVSSTLARSDYFEFNGRPPLLPINIASRPSHRALEEHFKLFLNQ
jgi:hypothetical protein